MLKLLYFFLSVTVALLSGCGSSEDQSVSVTPTEAIFSTITLDDNNLKLLIPMYVYPTSDSQDWKDLLDFKSANPRSDVTIIVNPSNGDFNTSDSNYIQAITDAKAKGIHLIGYVYTGYGDRNISKVETNIDAWRDLYATYGISGIFFDEASNKAADLDYYRTISQYARDDGFSFIVLNAGITTDVSYMDSNISDVIVDFESDYTDFIKENLQWNTPTQDTALCSMVYGVDSNLFLDVIERLKENQQEYIYITSNKLAYVWSSLSEYVVKSSTQ